MLDDAPQAASARLANPSRSPVDELARANRTLQSRVAELEAANAGLRRQLQQLAARPPGDACELHGRSACERCRGLAPACRLSAREREVLRLLTEGSRSPCIAEHLGITLATVEVHRRNIMRKLGLHTVAALTKYAVREGLTSL